ncbi:MAG: hypothetical protein CMJ85_00840 [Planctomycetes bacterium]|jgi:hypothetical protein|nr:hypothetical protein [Planctomycetota bacterium]MDP6424588.1 hypothetical protein [Planctomycetota bacterium]
MPKQRKPALTVVCPHCGTTFDPERLACPECGSDERTGWKSAEEIDYQSLDLPEGDELGTGRRMPRWMFVLIVILLLWAMLESVGAGPLAWLVS